MLKTLDKTATDRVFTIEASVTDAGGLTDTATLAVTIIGSKNSPPVMFCASSESLPENSPVGFKIAGALRATDIDIPAQILTYSLLSDGSLQTFVVNNATGEVDVASTGLNFESKSQYVINAQVTDNGIGFLSSMCLLSINLIDNVLRQYHCFYFDWPCAVRFLKI